MPLRASLTIWVLFVLAAQVSTAAPHVLDIDNRVGKFGTFYAPAAAKPMDCDARFALWQTEDGLAAVAYCAGWFLVGRLLDRGKTLPELARIPEGPDGGDNPLRDGRRSEADYADRLQISGHPHAAVIEPSPGPPDSRTID